MSGNTKILSNVLASVLVLGAVTGCSGSSTNGTGKQAPGASENKAAADQASKEPVKLSIMFFANAQPKMDDPIMQEMQKKTNTILQFDIPPQNNYTEKLRLMLAAGDRLPDVIFFPKVGTIQGISSNEFVQAKDAGILVPITQYFNQSKNLKTKFIQRPLDAININGEIWGIPHGDSTQFAPGFTIRADWAKKLNIDLARDGKPISLDKLVELAEAFTFKDPDGNGKNDTYGFNALVSGSDTAWRDLPPAPIKVAFGAGKGLMKSSNGQIEDSDLTFNWDNYKKSLKFFKDMVAKKIVDPDYFTSQAEILRDKLYKGKDGIVSNFGSAGSTLLSFLPNVQKVTPDADLVFATGLLGENGQQPDYYVGGPLDGGVFAVTKSSKNAEAAVKFFDWLASDEGQLLLHAGLEGTHYTLENGFPMRKTDEQKKAYDEYRKWYLATRLVVNKDRATDITFDFPNTGEIGRTVENWLNLSASKVKYNDDLGYRTPSQDKLIDLDKELYTAMVKFILGNIDEGQLDAARNKYINSTAFKASQKEYNDWYSKRK